MKINSRLSSVLGICCRNYEGPDYELVRRLASEGKNELAYYKMTQASIYTAVNVKKQLFSEPHKLFFNSLGFVGWVGSVRGKIKWWKEDDATLEKLVLGNETLCMGLLGGRKGAMSSAGKYSNFAATRGTYIHEILGPLVFKQANRIFPELVDHNTVVPGRLISKYFPLFAATPDGVTIKSVKDFEQLIEEGTCYGEEGRPKVIHELKTMQTERSMIPSRVVAALHSVYEQAGYRITPELKEQTVSLLAGAFTKGGWLRANSEADLQRKGKARGIFCQRGSNMYPTYHIREIKNTLVDNKYLNHIHDGRPGCVTDIRGYLEAPGKGTITVYSYVSGHDNQPIFSMEFDRAPFMLGVCSTFYLQMLTQYASTYHLNRDCKYVFTAAVSYQLNTLRKEPVRLAITYSYDTGIDFNRAIPFMEKSVSNLIKCDDTLGGTFARENVEKTRNILPEEEDEEDESSLTEDFPPEERLKLLREIEGLFDISAEIKALETEISLRQ